MKEKNRAALRDFLKLLSLALALDQMRRSSPVRGCFESANRRYGHLMMQVWLTCSYHSDEPNAMLRQNRHSLFSSDSRLSIYPTHPSYFPIPPEGAGMAKANDSTPASKKATIEVLCLISVDR